MCTLYHLYGILAAASQNSVASDLDFILLEHDTASKCKQYQAHDGQFSEALGAVMNKLKSIKSVTREYYTGFSYYLSQRRPF